MKKAMTLVFTLGIWSVLASSAHATSVSPDALVKSTTDQVIQELTANREMLMKDTNKLYSMVDRIVLPHFDFERMAKLVLGKHWRGANDAQRQKFIEQFKTLLVRTYATALFQYNGQKIVYKPFRQTAANEDAVVRTEIVPQDGPPVPLNYALSQGSDGNWKVYDIRIDGISLVTNYRTAYSNTIQNGGIDTLIAKLTEKNQSTQ